MDASEGVVAAGALALGCVGVLIGLTAPRQLRRAVLGRTRRATTAVAALLALSVALAIARNVVLGRQGTCPQPDATVVGGTSASLCELAAPWLLGWALAMGAIGLLGAGVVTGMLVMASRQAQQSRRDGRDLAE